jgi:hypothetical protein
LRDQRSIIECNVLVAVDISIEPAGLGEETRISSLLTVV